MLYQYTGEQIGVKWDGGDSESGIADYQFAAAGFVSPDGMSDDNGALLAPESTHKQNYVVSIRVGAIEDAPRIYYRITAKNKSAWPLLPSYDRCCFYANLTCLSCMLTSYQLSKRSRVRAQALSTIYLGPIIVDRDPPVALIAAPAFVVAQTSTGLGVSWPVASFSAPESGICLLEWCLGESSRTIPRARPSLLVRALSIVAPD